MLAAAAVPLPCSCCSTARLTMKLIMQRVNHCTWQTSVDDAAAASAATRQAGRAAPPTTRAPARAGGLSAAALPPPARAKAGTDLSQPQVCSTRNPSLDSTRTLSSPASCTVALLHCWRPDTCFPRAFLHCSCAPFWQQRIQAWLARSVSGSQAEKVRCKSLASQSSTHAVRGANPNFALCLPLLAFNALYSATHLIN